MQKTRTTRKPSKPITVSTKASIIIIAALFGLLIVSYIIVNLRNHIIGNKERSQYAATLNDVRDLKDVLVAQFQPDKIVETNGCGGISNTNEFEPDTPACSVGFVLNLDVADKDEAESKTNQISNELKGKRSYLTYESESSSLSNAYPPTQILEQQYKNRHKLGCGVSYTYYLGSHPPESPLNLSVNNKAGLMVSISCGGRTHSYSVI